MKLDPWNRGYYFGLFVGASCLLYIHFDDPDSLHWFSTILWAVVGVALWFAFKAVAQVVRHIYITRKIAKIQDEILRIKAEIDKVNNS